MKTQIGIADEHLKQTALALNKILADEILLSVKTRNYHWNVEGSNFMEMHKFYESQYNALDDIVDGVAERVRKLGHYAEGRLADIMKLTNLLEQEYSNDQKIQLTNLLRDHETIINELRRLIPVFSDEYKDAGSADFISGLMKEHETMAWMIRAYLG